MIRVLFCTDLHGDKRKYEKLFTAAKKETADICIVLLQTELDKADITVSNKP